MRSIECLVREFPDLTGKELLEIQEKDKVADEFAFQQKHKKDLEIIEDINTNGGYYRGRFGLNQYFYYSFSNLRMERDTIYCDCEHVVLFTGEGKDTDEFSVKIDKKTYKQFNNYGVNIYERVTKKEWDEVVNYLKKTTELFWPVKK